MDSRLRDELTRDEGKSLTAYKDSVGLFTIGVGHLLGPHARMTCITEQECDALLAGDVAVAEETVVRLIPVYICSRARWRALVNMAFNLGETRLAGFKKFLLAVRIGDYPTAAREMMDSKWATQVGARAERLRDMILNGGD